jgi:hypothetical protein
VVSRTIHRWGLDDSDLLFHHLEKYCCITTGFAYQSWFSLCDVFIAIGVSSLLFLGDCSFHRIGPNQPQVDDNSRNSVACSFIVHLISVSRNFQPIPTEILVATIFQETHEWNEPIRHEFGKRSTTLPFIASKKMEY